MCVNPPGQCGRKQEQSCSHGLSLSIVIGVCKAVESTFGQGGYLDDISAFTTGRDVSV